MTNNYYKINPKDAINISFGESLQKLKSLVGIDLFNKIFDKNKEISTPIKNNTNSNWLKQNKIIGINPRTIGTFWNIVKYAMTFPEESIHLLPIFECGCEGCLYSPINWKVNDEFLDENLFEFGFKTIEEQLKVVIKALHALGKTIGFDVLLHTDKFCELNFIYPQFFEWVKLNNDKINQLFYPDITPDLVHIGVQEEIIKYLRENGDFENKKINDEILNKFFDDDFSPNQREKLLFGQIKTVRNKRRYELMNFIRNAGYELISVTEYAPSRPVLFKKMVYQDDINYAEFDVEGRKESSKIFGNITPYKWYHLDNEAYPIKEGINKEVWNYFTDKIDKLQKEYNFDFIRADMGHNQFSYAYKDENKTLNSTEIWAEIKKKIQKRIPYFAIFAESFFTKLGFVDVYDDSENKGFDVVLGALHYIFLNEKYCNKFQEYVNLNRKFLPCCAYISADTDTNILDNVYVSDNANQARFFLSMFSKLPSYMVMGAELRQVEVQALEEYNQTFIKNFDKKYKWGKNYEFFNEISKMRELYVKLKPLIQNSEMKLVEFNNDSFLGWFFVDKNNKPLYLFLTSFNLDLGKSVELLNLPRNYKLDLVYSDFNRENISFNTIDKLEISGMQTGEVQIYKFSEKLDFKNSKNPDEILIVSSECYPFIKIGGISNINHDFIKNFQEKYKNKKIKIVLPFCNNKKMGIFDTYNCKIEKTNIKAKFEYGFNTSTATLYKTTYNDICVYLVNFPELFDEHFNEKALYFMYSKAVFKLLAKMKKYCNPYLIQTTDWHCTLLNYLIKTSSDKFYQEFKTVHIVHNAGVKYLGYTNAFIFMLFVLDNKQIKILLKNQRFCEYINKIVEIFPECFPHKNNNIKNQLNIICKNYDYLIDNCYNLFNKISNLISTLFMDEFCWDYKLKNNVIYPFFNPTKLAINYVDKWVTDSNSYFEELIEGTNYEDNDFSLEFFKKNQNKGSGIICAVDKDRYSSQNSNEVKYVYNKSNYIEQKSKNKHYVQEFFSDKQLMLNSYFANRNYQFLKLGYLDINPDIPLLFASSRFDLYQKGVDVLFEAVEKLLEDGNNFQIIFAYYGALHSGKIAVKKLADKILNDDLFKGKVMIIDNFVPVQQYFAASDIFIFPSRYEPCGLM